jgi:hypothetical protein
VRKTLNIIELEEEDSDAIVERSYLTSNALKKGLGLADKLVDHFLGIRHFMDRYLKLGAWGSIVVKALCY